MSEEKPSSAEAMGGKEEIKKKVKIIEAIHQEYIKKLDGFRKKQDQIITDFIKELKNKKAETKKKSLFRRFLDKIFRK